jgi:hypothetical protein
LNAGHRREDIDHLVDILGRNQHLADPTVSPGRAPTGIAAPQQLSHH